MLRRLFVVAITTAFVTVPAARAGTVAIFYYPWYATAAHDGAWEHWNQNAHNPPGDIYSRYDPATGPYSSSGPAVVDQQMAEIAAAGVDEVVISWWGRGSAEDQRLPLVLAAVRRHHLRPAIHLEPYPGRSPATVAQDLPYLAALGSPGYDGTRAGEAPVLNARRDGATYDELWTAALAAHPDMVTITSFNEWGEGTQIEPAAARPGYISYDGAWGLSGTAAQTAYLMRTAYWAGRLHSDDG